MVKVHRDVVEDECGEAENAAILVARVVAKQELVVSKHLGMGSDNPDEMSDNKIEIN